MQPKLTEKGNVMTNPLPADPEGMNDQRAAWAAASIRCFQKQTGTDRDTALLDLLCDLMHFCDRNGFDFDHELARGRLHYKEETTALEETM